MKLCNPKFGLHSTMFNMSEDGGDSFSVLAASEKNRIAELEEQIHSLNCELSGLRENNVHLEETMDALQRNCKNAELHNELKRIQNERDIAAATSAKNNELLNRIKKEKQPIQTRLLRAEEELEKMSNKSANLIEVNGAPETVHDDDTLADNTREDVHEESSKSKSTLSRDRQGTGTINNNLDQTIGPQNNFL